MSYDSTVWTVLERWSPGGFLAAAGLFGLPAAIFGAATGAVNVVSSVVSFVSTVVVGSTLTLATFAGVSLRMGVHSRLVGGSMGSIGYVHRIEAPPAEMWNSTGDVTAN